MSSSQERIRFLCVRVGGEYLLILDTETVLYSGEVRMETSRLVLILVHDFYSNR